VIAASVVHLHYEGSTLRARLHFFCLTAGYRVVSDDSDLASSLKMGRIASLIRMPFLSAMVAEVRITSGLLAFEFGATGASVCDDRVPAIRSGTPSAVGIDAEDFPQHEIFVLVHHLALLLSQDPLHVTRVDPFLALRTRHIHPAFSDLNNNVLTKAVRARKMAASLKLVEFL